MVENQIVRSLVSPSIVSESSHTFLAEISRADQAELGELAISFGILRTKGPGTFCKAMFTGLRSNLRGLLDD